MRRPIKRRCAATPTSRPSTWCWPPPTRPATPGSGKPWPRSWTPPPCRTTGGGAPEAAGRPFARAPNACSTTSNAPRAIGQRGHLLLQVLPECALSGYSRRVNVPTTLLGLLEPEPSHGYELKREYDEMFGGG